MNNNFSKDQLLTLFKAKEYDLFEKNAQRFLKYQNDKEILILLSETYIEKQKFNSARKLLLEVIEIEGQSSSAMMNLGRLYFIANKSKDSKIIYSEILKKDSKSIGALEGLALNCMKLKEFKNAILYLKEIINIDNSYEKAFLLLGEIYMINEDFENSYKYYSMSNSDKAKTKQLECLYLLGNEEKFLEKLNFFIDKNKNYPLVASLASHFFYRKKLDNKYLFSSKPLELIYEKNLLELDNFDNDFIKQIINDFNKTIITKREQNLLEGGFQSGGNIFDQNFLTFKKLKEIINDELKNYVKNFLKTDDNLIKNFPKKFSLSGWIIHMRKNDYLKSHIHENGWISGSIYLNIPKKIKKYEGDIKFSISGGKLENNDNFPSKIVNIEKGSLILFPSSLYHSTIPFENSKSERMTLAFDVRPDFN